ncbi:unnamed protein product [Effrenium voratum]|nr:unnamed protein product [Effrenium voratum]
MVHGECVPEERPVTLTTTTTGLAALREMGFLSLHRRSRYWAQPVQKSESTRTEHKEASVAFVVVWLGPLPSYVAAFAATAAQAGASFLVFHTHEEPSPSSGKVEFRYMSLEDLAGRLWNIEPVRNHFKLSFAEFAQRVAECYADDNPAKGNDLKPFYGALFSEELSQFSHWGWTDLDMIWGNLEGFLTAELLEGYDVISAPDGARPALYLSGQLTVFRNNEVWRGFMEGCLAGGGHVNYGGCYVESLLSEANVFLDEKVAIWHAALRGARIFVDFSLLLAEPRWQRLGGGILRRGRGGRLLLAGQPAWEPFVDIERRNMEVHLLENSSDCYTEFGEGWSYVCIPSEANDALGVAYEINGSLFLWPSPLHAVEGGVEFAAMHLHRSKAKFSMEDCRDSEDVSCQKEGSAISCECAAPTSNRHLAETFRIPNIVHFVLTDRDTRFFDWPCYAALRSAWEQLRPEKLLVHLLDGVEPSTANAWWEAARRFVTGVIPFPRSSVPLALNGVLVTHPAFIADFHRMEVLYQWGGIYMDTDAISLRGFDSLRRWRAVLARQGGRELRATVGLMIFEPRSAFLSAVLERMKRAYSGAWGVHAGHVLDDTLETRPPGVAILGHSGGFFASSWHAGDFVELMEEAKLVDWSRCWSLHLYNSQTKKYTKDPIELCRNPGSPYKDGDLCRGLRMALDMNDIFSMVDQGYPIMSSSLEETFRKRAAEQASAFPDLVSNSLDIRRVSEKAEL